MLTRKRAVGLGAESSKPVFLLMPTSLESCRVSLSKSQPPTTTHIHTHTHTYTCPPTPSQAFSWIISTTPFQSIVLVPFLIHYPVHSPYNQIRSCFLTTWRHRAWVSTWSSLNSSLGWSWSFTSFLSPLPPHPLQAPNNCPLTPWSLGTRSSFPGFPSFLLWGLKNSYSFFFFPFLLILLSASSEVTFSVKCSLIAPGRVTHSCSRLPGSPPLVKCLSHHKYLLSQLHLPPTTGSKSMLLLTLSVAHITSQSDQFTLCVVSKSL